MAADVGLSVAALAGMGIGGYFLYKAFEYTPGQNPDQGFYQDDDDAGCVDASCCPNGTLWDPIARRCKMAGQSDACDEGYTWVTKQNRCMPLQDIGCKPGFHWNTNVGQCVGDNDSGGNWIDQISQRGGASSLYDNYNKYVEEVEQGSVDEFGCFDSQYTTKSAGGKEVAVKICGDAQSCWHEMIKGRFADPNAPDDDEYGEWGQKVNAGLATCGVLGGAQSGTVTFMNARQVKAYQDFIGDNIATQEDMKEQDYAEWGQQVPWDALINGTTTYDWDAAEDSTVIGPVQDAAGPPGWYAGPAQCTRTIDISRKDFDNSTPSQQALLIRKHNMEVAAGNGQCIRWVK